VLSEWRRAGRLRPGDRRDGDGWRKDTFRCVGFLHEFHSKLDYIRLLQGRDLLVAADRYGLPCEPRPRASAKFQPSPKVVGGIGALANYLGHEPTTMCVRASASFKSHPPKLSGSSFPLVDVDKQFPKHSRNEGTSVEEARDVSCSPRLLPL